MQGETLQMSISSDSKFIATYHEDNNIRIYDVENTLIMGQILLDIKEITDISFTNSDKNIGVTSDKYVYVIDFPNNLDKFLITRQENIELVAHLNNGMVACCNDS